MVINVVKLIKYTIYIILPLVLSFILFSVIFHVYYFSKIFHFDVRYVSINPSKHIKAVLVSEGPEGMEDNYLDYHSGIHVLKVKQELESFRPWYRWYSLRPKTEVLRGKFIGRFPNFDASKLEWVSDTTLLYRFCDDRIFNFQNTLIIPVDGKELEIEIILHKKC